MIAEPPIFTAKKWTSKEVSAIPDDVRRELYDGEIYKMPSPTLTHQDIILRLALLLSLVARQQGGKVFLSPVDLFVSEERYFIPDLVFYSAEKMASGEVEADPKRLHIAPDLIVEIISNSTAINDRVRKYRAYAEFGVPFYWIVDPAPRTFHAFRLENGRYVDEAVLGDDEAFSPQLCPGLEVSLLEVFGGPAPLEFVPEP